MVSFSDPLQVSRNITPLLYVFTGLATLVLLFLLRRKGFWRLGLAVEFVGFLGNMCWETSMIITGVRAYDSSFLFGLEMVYHALTEFAPFIMLIVLVLDRFSLMDLSMYRDMAIRDGNKGTGRKGSSRGEKS